MTRFTNILAAVALATAFLPIAANATTMTPLHQVQIVAHQALSGPMPDVQRVAISAQAHTVSQANVMPPTAQSWATNFGFLPFNSSSCTHVQMGFWPRPLDCKR